ncbi:hypothetical protein KC316_g783 [Hortaea werneckii]|nr:hypothetical protein KC324_g850 [Hortaea werneckii]KAI7595042.1 hypothetical protein KC316_g783 [Hortaea werneckii]
MSHALLPSHRRYASQACNACRESKVQCDGGTPVCSKCLKKDRECTYRVVDKRKLPLRAAIDLLSGRIAQLCAFISDNKLQPPAMPLEKRESLRRALASLGMHATVKELSMTDEAHAAHAQHDASPTFEGMETEGGSPAPLSSMPAAASIDSPMPACDIAEGANLYRDDLFGTALQPWDSHTGTESTFDPLNLPDLLITTDTHSVGWPNESACEQLQDPQRLLSLPTENEHQRECASDEDSGNESLIDELSCRVSTLVIGHDGQTKLRGASSIPQLDQTESGNNPPQLKSAVLSPSHIEDLSQVPVWLQEHLTNLYFTWENSFSDFVDRDVFNVAKGQFEKGGSTSYFSHALHNAICQHLKLIYVEDCSGASILLISFQLGRPVRTNTEDATVGRPSVSASYSDDTHPLSGTSTASVSAVSEGWSVTRALRPHHIAICDIMSTCGYLLYETSKYSKDALQRLNAGVVARVQDWKAKLPSPFRIDLENPKQQCHPPVLVLHMHYYQSIMYAHRPWMSKHILQSQPMRGPGYKHARGMCVQSALAVAKILLIYERQHGMRQIHHSAVHIIATAALILLSADFCSFPDWKSEAIRASLGTCFRALGQLDSTWRSARQANDVLIALQQKWHDRHARTALTRNVPAATHAFGQSSRNDSGIPDPASGQPLTWSQEEEDLQREFMFDPIVDWTLLPTTF